jgi:hypothetical protein
MQNNQLIPAGVGEIASEVDWVVDHRLTEQFNADPRPIGRLVGTHLLGTTRATPEGYHSLYTGSQYLPPTLTYNVIVDHFQLGTGTMLIYRVLPLDILCGTDFSQQGPLISTVEAFHNYPNSFKFFYPTLRVMPELAR